MAVATLPARRTLEEIAGNSRASARQHLTVFYDTRGANGMSYPQAPHTAGPQSGTLPSPPMDRDNSLSSVDLQDPSSTSSSLAKRRRSSKVPEAIKRSASQPHLRNLANADSSSLPSPTGDKRRNKLGYHRTSVACGHCRRRKIRCLLAPDDPQGRCSNCIRLKKECNFYPVDQGEAIKAESGVPNTSSPSSPRNLPSLSGHDSSAHLSAYAPLSLQSSPNALPLGSNTELSHGELPPQAYTYPHAHGMSPEQQWPLPHMPAHSSTLTSPSGGNSPAYWSHMQSSMPPPTVAGTAFHGIVPSTPNSHMSYQQGDMGWSAPSRSMSFGHLESMPQYQQYNVARQQLPTQAQYAYPTQVNSTISPIEISLPESMSGAIPPTLSSSIQPAFQFQPTWEQFAPQPQPNHIVDSASATFAPAQWPTPLENVEEEQQQQQQQQSNHLPAQYAHPPYYAEPPRNPG